ncbi:MAG: FAD-dependent oxidoreductase [Pseudomonadota bacterium]
MASKDVTVRGAGIFGLSVAFACLRRGATVRVVDPNGPGAGASGGILGALAPHTPENWNAKKAFQLDALLAAEDYWREISELSGADPGYCRTGRVQPVLDPRGLELARARAQSAETLWQGEAVWRVIPCEEAKGLLPASPTGWLIHDSLSARIHPRAACAALAKAIETLGGEIVKEAETEGQEVLATGWQGLLALSAELERLIGYGVKGQAVLVKYSAPQASQVFADALHIVPHGDGTTAIGSTSERAFGDPHATDEGCDALIAKAREVCPELVGAEVLEKWAAVRPRARSRAPMLGPHPKRRDCYIANGGFKIGFGMAPKVGEVMATLLLEQQDTVPFGFRVEDSL